MTPFLTVWSPLSRAFFFAPIGISMGSVGEKMRPRRREGIAWDKNRQTVSLGAELQILQLNKFLAGGRSDLSPISALPVLIKLAKL